MRSVQVISGENALAQQFTNLRHDARIAGDLKAHQQLGYFTLSTNPTNGKTLTFDINGTNVVLTFVSSIGSTAGNVLIGASAAATCANLLALLNQPQTTTANGVALSAANQTLVSYLSYALSGTTLTVSSNNTNLYAPLSSFSASTNATSDSYTAQTMQLYVEPGVFYVAGTRVIFAGGSTPTVTAPSSHPRIDVLSINSSGTLSWTTGSENSSPVAPTYPNPASNLVICELYNVVSETLLYDFDNQTAAQGYVYNDVRTVQQPAMNWGAFTADFIPDADGTRNLGSGSSEWNNGYFKTAVLVGGVGVAVAKFGGTGADGALSVSSGTTTVSVGNASLFVKNYSSIAVTGTGVLAFNNPATAGTLILLRSTGAVTLTSSATPMLDASGMGGQGGAAVTAGTTGQLIVDGGTHNGLAGASSGSTVTGGTAMAAPLGIYTRTAAQFAQRSTIVFCGNGGGGGGNGSGGTGGTGGAGGGAFILECGGAFNFTTTGGISVSGKNGGSPTGVGGGGGGGSCGSCVIIYNTLTANSGTVTASSGNGANGNAAGGSSQCGSGGSGAGGYGGGGGTGGGGGNNNAGSGGGNAGGAGGGGGGAGGSSGAGGAQTGGTGSADSGAALVTQNLFFS
jgi:hypothetical protein